MELMANAGDLKSLDTQDAIKTILVNWQFLVGIGR